MAANTLNRVLVIDGETRLESFLEGDLSLTEIIDGEAGVVIAGTGSDYPVYTGPTEFTPTQGMQYAYTAGKSVLTNIIINPIPSNYGLITWDGSTLTVS